MSSAWFVASTSLIPTPLSRHLAYRRCLSPPSRATPDVLFSACPLLRASTCTLNVCKPIISSTHSLPALPVAAKTVTVFLVMGALLPRPFHVFSGRLTARFNDGAQRRPLQPLP